MGTGLQLLTIDCAGAMVCRGYSMVAGTWGWVCRGSRMVAPRVDCISIDAWYPYQGIPIPGDTQGTCYPSDSPGLIGLGIDLMHDAMGVLHLFIFGVYHALLFIYYHLSPCIAYLVLSCRRIPFTD